MKRYKTSRTSHSEHGAVLVENIWLIVFIAVVVSAPIIALMPYLKRESFCRLERGFDQNAQINEDPTLDPGEVICIVPNNGNNGYTVIR